MTSENGSSVMSLPTESPDSEVATYTTASASCNSSQPTSSDSTQSTLTSSSESFYTDTSPDQWPMTAIANSNRASSSGFFPGASTNTLNPNSQHQPSSVRQFSQMVIPTFHGSQTPPACASQSDSNGCQQSPSKVHKRHASNSGRRGAHEKTSRTALGSDQIVEKSGFGVPHRRGGRDLDRMGGNKGGRVNDGFHRRWTFTRFANDVFRGRVKPSTCKQLDFTVASYNVLAQNLLEDHRELYEGCDPSVLEWQYRRTNLLRDIKKHQPDILCLQEVTAEHYEQFFLPELTQLGYEGQYKKRTRLFRDGCATFYKSNKFQLKHCEPVEYLTPRGGVLDRDNVALLLVLSPKLQPSCSVCVANTHLLFNPRRGDVKLAQLMVLLSKIDQLTYKGSTDFSGPPTDIPSILCGDFNLMPTSQLYTLLNSGELAYEGLVTRTLSGQVTSTSPNRYETLMTSCVVPGSMSIADQCHYIGEDEKRPHTQGSGTMSHGLNLRSVYRDYVNGRGEKEVTTHHRLTNEAVDYIFYSQTKTEAAEANSGRLATKCDGPMRLMGSLQLMTSEQMDNFGVMPNKHLSSDHLMLLARFLWDLK